MAEDADLSPSLMTSGWGACQPHGPQPPHIRKPKNFRKLQPQLVFIQGPETFSQAIQIDLANLVELQLEGRDIVPVLDVELKQGQDERHADAEEQNSAQQA
jgi:hypothetical protein